jgi:hypothetical protein
MLDLRSSEVRRMQHHHHHLPVSRDAIVALTILVLTAAFSVVFGIVGLTLMHR